MSEIKYAVTQFSWPTSTGTFDVTIPSLGWTPKACKVTVLGSVTNESAENGAYAGVGFSDASNQRSVSVYNGDGDASIIAKRAQSTSGIIFNSTSIGRLDFLVGTAGPISDGWKIDCINTVATARLCIIEFFGGADLSADVSTFTPAATGNTTKTGLPFAPNLLFVAGIGGSGASAQAHNVFSYGAAYDGASVEQGGILSELGVDGNTAQISTAKLSTSLIAAQVHNGSQNWIGSISAFTSDGWAFSVDGGNTGGSDDLMVLALDIGDRKATVKSIDAPTSAVLDWTITGIGFEPQGLSLIPSMMEFADIDVLKTDQKAGYLAFSATDGVRMVSHSNTVEDSALTSNAARVSALKTAHMLDTSDAVLFDIGLPTFEPDGWTVDAADISAAQATQRKWLAVAIEVEAGGAGPVGTVTETDTVQTPSASESQAGGMVTETDTVQAISASESRSVGTATEADAVQAITARESRSVSTIMETDVLAALPGVSPVVGTVTESDTVQPITASEAEAVGLISEIDTVQPATASESLAVGVAVETDTVQAASASESLAVGTVSETDVLVALPGVTPPVGTVTETDTIQSAAASESLAVGTITETDVLVALPTATSGLVGTVTETDTVASISARQAHTVAVISETDILTAVSPALGRQVGLVTEADVVLSVFSSSAFTVGLVNGIDTVLPLAGLDVYRYPTPGAVLARPDLAGPDLSRPTIAAQLTSTIEVSND